jgi:chemotaxis protein methyltransferase CheR
MIMATNPSMGYSNHLLASSNQEMPDTLFRQFSKLIYEESGINLTLHKKTMLAARLHKRLRSLGISSFADYYDYLSDMKIPHDELIHFLDTVSTNKTEFYRESSHFDFLGSVALPELVKSPAFKAGGVITIWSAGCSSGEEAYTAAVVADDFFGEGVGCYRVIATDICTRVLGKGFHGIYPDANLDSVPLHLKRRYFMKGIGDQKGHHRIVPEIRRNVVFKRHNLVKNDFESIPMMGVIFCRNVAIYFDRETQLRMYDRLVDKLLPGGYLFIGHSEMMKQSNKELDRVAPTIYQKKK